MGRNEPGRRGAGVWLARRSRVHIGRRAASVAAVAVLAGLGLVACGSTESLATQGAPSATSTGGSMPGSTKVGTTSSSAPSTSSTTSAPGTTATSIPPRPPVCPIIEEINETDFGPDAALVVERYRAAGDASPEELRPHWEALVRPFELLATIEPGDPAHQLKMLEVNELGRDPSFLAGIRAIDEFARADCGIRAGFQLHGP